VEKPEKPDLLEKQELLAPKEKQDLVEKPEKQDLLAPKEKQVFKVFLVLL